VAIQSLHDYESSKFELAEVLRAIKSRVPKAEVDLDNHVTTLFTRLAEDRFNLVVVGRFSRGKSTLMNAVLGVDRLPMGILPLTSVITSVAYASREDIRIEFEHGGLDHEIQLENLADYITERGNPRNTKRVSEARIGLPVELLRRGFYFVDTPGLGSNIIENARTTEGFLPEADAFVMVSGYDAPLSDDEMRVARRVARFGRPVFFVLNKQDMVSESERLEVYSYVQSQLSTIFDGGAPKIFSVSARDALQAKLAADAPRLAASGLPALEHELTRFLIEDKSREFLGAICDRSLQCLAETKPDREAERLRSRIAAVRNRHLEQRPLRVEESNEGSETSNTRTKVTECPLCARVGDALFEFLCQLQYDLVMSAEARERFASGAGLCEMHLCHYASMASERGICIALTPLMRRMTTTLRATAAHLAGDNRLALRDTLKLTGRSCVACEVQWATEEMAIKEILTSCSKRGVAVTDKLPFLCIPHIRVAMSHVSDPSWLVALLRSEASGAQRLCEDMQRYVLKRDGVRHRLATDEECRAAKDSIAFIASRR
jgi:GTP-binding protein EngB required for normal cell division